MSHPTVVETIKVLAEMSQRLQDENDALKAVLARTERPWVGLTPTDMEELSAEWWEPNENETTLIAWVEAKLKEKNT